MSKITESFPFSYYTIPIPLLLVKRTRLSSLTIHTFVHVKNIKKIIFNHFFLTYPVIYHKIIDNTAVTYELAN